MNENLTVVTQSPVSDEAITVFGSSTLTVKSGSITPLDIEFNMAIDPETFHNISPQPDAGFNFEIVEIVDTDTPDFIPKIAPYFNVYVDRKNNLHVKDTVPDGAIFAIVAKSCWLTPSDDEMPENSLYDYCVVTVDNS